MRDQVQTGLRIAAAFFLLWALALVSDPLATHKLISVGPLDPVTLNMLAGSFLGFAILLLLAANEPQKDIIGGMAAMMLIVGVISTFSMAGSHAMPTNIFTVLSTIFALGMGAYLIADQMQEMFASGTGGRARPKAKKKPAKKAKKKVAKKKAKKKATKKKRR